MGQVLARTGFLDGTGIVCRIACEVQVSRWAPRSRIESSAMKRLGGVVMMAMLGGVAQAQAVPPDPPPPPPPAPYGGPSAVPPAYAYQPRPLQLTPEDQELLAEGELPVGYYV